MTIAQTIKAFRKQRGLTQARLGALCRLSAGAIACYERGTTVPKRRTLEKIAAALDVPVEKFTQTPPAPVSTADATGDGLLYDGVLAALRELYGIVEGRVVMGENGATRRYYVVKGAPESFVLYEKDIAAIARAAKASMLPLAAHLKRAAGDRP